MRRYRKRLGEFGLACAFLCCMCLPVATAQNVGPSLEKTVLTPQAAYSLLPAELLAAPTVTSVSISPDESAIIATRMSVTIPSSALRDPASVSGPSSMETSLVLWDSRTRSSRTVWASSLEESHIQQVAWIPQTGIALALVREAVANPTDGLPARYALYRISASGGKAERVAMSDGGQDSLGFEVSPSRPMAVMVAFQAVPAPPQTPDSNPPPEPSIRRTFTLIGKDGRFGASVSVPSDLAGGDLRWDTSGNPVLRTQNLTSEEGADRFRWHQIDPSTAELKPLPDRPVLFGAKEPSPETPSALPIRLKPVKATVKEQESAEDLQVLWLESTTQGERPRVVVSADVKEGRMLRSGEGVVFQSQGAAWIAPVMRLTLDQYGMISASVQRAALINRAKQIAMGFILYSQDWDGKLPTKNELSNVASYIKDADPYALFNGWISSTTAKNLNEIDDPAQTELGYLIGPGGRAVLFADGHVIWKSNTP